MACALAAIVAGSLAAAYVGHKTVMLHARVAATSEFNRRLAGSLKEMPEFFKDRTLAMQGAADAVSAFAPGLPSLDQLARVRGCSGWHPVGSCREHSSASPCDPLTQQPRDSG